MKYQNGTYDLDVSISIDENKPYDEVSTHSIVRLESRSHGTFMGEGWATKIPSDPNNVFVGNMLSTARALRQLADKMEERARSLNAEDCYRQEVVRRRERRKLRHRARRYVKNNVPEQLREFITVP